MPPVPDPPVRPALFFEGSWEGTGEIVGRCLLRWLLPREPFDLSTRFERISDSIWVVRDHMVLRKGGEIRRSMFLERTAPDRCHVTADDMPLGSDVAWDEAGYRYAPYWSWSSLRGRRWFVRVREEGVFTPDGAIRGWILVSWHGLPMARTDFVLRRCGETGSRGASR